LNLQTNLYVVQLLKIEWLKVKNYGAFIVLSLFFVLGVVASNYAVLSFKKNVIDKSDPTGLISGVSLYSFPQTWQTTSYTSGCLLLLPGLLLILLVTNEFGYRTHRQNIIDGWSRKDFINVKVAMAVIIALVSTLLVFITASIFGFASGSSFSFDKIESLGFFFLKALSYNMIALLFSVLVRKTGFAIGLFFIYMWFENFIAGMLEMLSYYLKQKSNFDIGNMGDYLPMNASDGLLHFPNKTLSDLAKSGVLVPHDYMYAGLAIAILYLLLFFVWSRSRIANTDL
jgi:ABC-2 type transport system permease protein